MIAVVAALVLALAGCGRSPIDESTDGVPPEQATGTLRVLVPSFPASNEGKAAFQQVADRFNQTYPKMTVEPDYATYDNLNEKISTSIAAGIPYDVIVVGVGWIPPFAAKKIFLDLGEFGLDPEQLNERTIPAMTPSASYEGKVYGVPLVADTRAFALRKSAFREAGLDPNDPPQTMAEIKEAAQRLTRRDDAGTITRPGFDFFASSSYRQNFLWMLDSTGTPLYKNAQPNFNNEQGLRTLNWLTAMVGDVQEYGQVNAAEEPMVYTGDAAMGVTTGMVDCSADGIGQQNCDDLKFFLPDNGKPSEFVGGDIAAIGARSKHQEAAWAFISELTTRQSLDNIAELNNKLPAYPAVADSELARSNPLSTFTAKHVDAVAYEGGPANWLDLRPKFDSKLDQVLLGERPADQVLQELAEQSQADLGGT